MAGRTIRIATRESKLAQVQARKLGDNLVKAFPDVSYELHFVTTTGDKFMGNLAKVGGKVAFVKEIQDTLLKREADIAVHSMKDVPTDDVDGLVIKGMIARDDLRDAAVCRKGETFAGLKEGAVVGTSSVRRGAQIKHTFPHLEVRPVRGNVQTRIAKLDSGDYDALILAKCGLDRLNLQERITAVLEPDMMCPSVAQGAIGAECRRADTELMQMLETITHRDTWRCVETERLFLDRLGGNCHTPIGGFVDVTKGGNLRLIGLVASLDGSKVLRTRHKMPYDDWRDLAITAADDLMSQGAEALIKETEDHHKVVVGES